MKVKPEKFSGPQPILGEVFWDIAENSPKFTWGEVNWGLHKLAVLSSTLHADAIP